MEKTTFKIVITTIAIAAGFGVAYASPGKGERPSFETLDVDGSGEITAEDLATLRQNRFNDMDTDGNGSINEAEFLAAAQSRSAEKAAKMFARLDADGDGMLNQDALANAKRRGGGTRMIEKLDSDGSGGVSEEEFAEMKHHKRGKRKGDRDQSED